MIFLSAEIRCCCCEDTTEYEPMIFPQTAKLLRPTFGKDRHGGSTQSSETVVQTGIICNVQPDNSFEGVQLGRLNGTTPFRVYTQAELAVRPSDVLIPLSGAYANQRLSVTGKMMDMSGRQRYFRYNAELNLSNQAQQGQGT